MIKLLKNSNQLGIFFLGDSFGLVVFKTKDEFISYAITIRILRIDLTISLGMEKVNVEEIKKAIEESKGYDASA